MQLHPVIRSFPSKGYLALQQMCINTSDAQFKAFIYCSRALVESYALSVQDFQLQSTPLKSISQHGISASL